MRMHLPAPRTRTRTRAQRATAETSARPRTWKARWLELTVVTAAIAVAAVCLAKAWTAPLELVPLLAVPPALAGVGATTIKRPLAYGIAALITGVIVDALVKGGITVTDGTHELPLAAIGAVVVVTVLSMIGTRVGTDNKTTQQEQQAQQIVDVTSVAEAAQRAVLRQLPETVGPLTIGVVYLAAAAEARVGGDLYEVAATGDHGVRLIIGDVRGKGLEAVEVAADIIGRFRELAHSVHTLDEIAYRLDAGLSRRWGQHEEFVTALLVQIDIEKGRLTIFNCGHPPPILISQSAGVSVLEVRAPAPPLGLITLGQRFRGEGDVRLQPERPASSLHRRRHRGARREQGVLPARRAGRHPGTPGAAEARQIRASRGQATRQPLFPEPARPGPRRSDQVRRLAAPRRRGHAAHPRAGLLARRPPRPATAR